MRVSARLTGRCPSAAVERRRARLRAAKLVGLAWCGLLLVAGAGCSDNTAGSRDGGGAQEVGCAVVQQHASEGATHVMQCSPTFYGTNPPSSGNHYPYWAAYRTYDSPVPPGFLVHSLEHGAVVISYSCSDGCPADVARIQAFIDALPLDVACGNTRKKIILAPDPTLTVRFAAAAWTWTLRAACFDEAIFGQFVTDHYGRAPESVCVDGMDLSATSWCP